MRHRYALLASIIALALSDSFSAYGFKTSQPQLKPGRKYTTIERMQPERLRAVSEARSLYQRKRHSVSLETGYTDFRGVMHVHTEDSTHTGGTRRELIAAAKSAGVQIVMLTDHVIPSRDFVNADSRGMVDGVLLIPGAESEGFVVFPLRSMINAYVERKFTTLDDYIKVAKDAAGLLFLSHVEERAEGPLGEIEGLEIYNHHADFDDEGEFVRWLRFSFIDPDRLKQVERLLTEYPMEVFGASQDYQAQIIARWDRSLQRQRATGIAANDCHHNQVFTVKTAQPDGILVNAVGETPRKITVEQAPRIAELLKNRGSGDVIAKLDFDPYERSMRYITTHFLIRDLNESSVRQALRQSHVYVAHDWLCDPTGFAFIVESGNKRAGVMGDEVKIGKGMKMRVETPVAGLIKLFLNGRVINESRSDRLSYALDQPGIYRAEVWLEVDGEMRPWIYANPIRVAK
ncbi:MAG TPA: histidinol phosphatase [Blastocatellia bacterium]|nr:histidinol phosphatase [Blastocatellia bacterium]